MRLALILTSAFLFASPTQPEQGLTSPGKDACKDVILEKEIADFTRILEAGGDKLKLGILTEDITWHDEYPPRCY
jgi:hypothetical protein